MSDNRSAGGLADMDQRQTWPGCHPACATLLKWMSSRFDLRKQSNGPWACKTYAAV